MSFSDINRAGSYLYTVQVAKFAEGHFLKKFKKKYPGVWDTTYEAITSMLERIDSLAEKTEKAEIISVSGTQKLVKVFFRVAKTKQSAKASGNRLIVWVNEETKICLILLVYSKNDIPTHNETQEWKKLVKENYPELKKIFRL